MGKNVIPRGTSAFTHASISVGVNVVLTKRSFTKLIASLPVWPHSVVWTLTVNQANAGRESLAAGVS